MYKNDASLIEATEIIKRHMVISNLQRFWIIAKARENNCSASEADPDDGYWRQTETKFRIEAEGGFEFRKQGVSYCNSPMRTMKPLAAGPPWGRTRVTCSDRSSS